jgi:hypothetical protein
MSQIGTLQESSLHSDLKKWYARPGDRLEEVVDGYVVDICRDNLLIEIQTGQFAAVKQKLRALLSQHPVHLVYPIPQEKWILRLAADGQTHVSRRKSPKRGSFYDVFRELVRLPALLNEPNFSLELLLVRVEEVWCDDGRGSWRRKKWSIQDRRLLDVLGQMQLGSAEGLAAQLLPGALPAFFTTAELAAAIGRPRVVAQQMAYCLRLLEQIEVAGKQGNALLYRLPQYHS